MERTETTERPISFHRYGHSTETPQGIWRGGRAGDLSGADYWTESNGRRWEIESDRAPWLPTFWLAWTYQDDGSIVSVSAWSRQALKDKIALVEL